MKNISIIVAVARNGAIGKDNDLLWHIPEDFKWFRKHTKGNPVIMGRNTWESLPARPLKGRTNIVISDRKDEVYEGCTVVSSIDEAIEEMSDEKENFIIGGGSVYRQFLPLADKFYLTRVHRDYDADIFFPEFNQDEWKEVFREDHLHQDDQNPAYSFIIYKRVSGPSRD